VLVASNTGTLDVNGNNAVLGAITGSANFTTGGEEPQDNDALWTDDAACIAYFQSKFTAMWNRPDNLSPQIAVQQSTSYRARVNRSH